MNQDINELTQTLLMGLRPVGSEAKMKYLIKWIQDWEGLNKENESTIRYAIQLIVDTSTGDDLKETEATKKFREIKAKMQKTVGQWFNEANPEAAKATKKAEEIAKLIETKVRQWLSEVDPSKLLFLSDIASVLMILPEIHGFVMEIKDSKALSMYLDYDHTLLENGIRLALKRKSIPPELSLEVFRKLVDSVMVDKLMTFDSSKKLGRRIVHHLWLEDKTRSLKQNTSAPRP